MEQNEIKMLVAKMLADEKKLTEIQNVLRQEHNINMTFLELRLLAAELDDVDWSKFNKQEEKPEQPSDIDSDGAQTAGDNMDNVLETDSPADSSINSSEQELGKTVVTLSKIVRPGAVASGTVKFASGASAEWILDQMGRLGLDKTDGKPTPEDLQDFQVELQKVITGAV